MKDFLDYDIKYPDLIRKLIVFFSKNETKKTIMDFCNSFKVSEGSEKIQPDIVGRICERLCNMRKLICIQREGFGYTNFSYYATPLDSNNNDILTHYFNSCVYGFEYIYRSYKERTIPIIASMNGEQTMGTCFKIFDGIATAKHCLENGTIAIKGYTKKQLDSFKVFISNNPNIDLAYIKTGEKYYYNNAEPHVLDNVIVMGYPKLPFFINFCTGEKANISAMADLRFTPTMGSIVANAELYYPKSLPKMLLITAKIKGGNSGGPVVNEEGFVVGITTDIPAGQGNSDDNVGYGIAYPIKALVDVINGNDTMKPTFTDYPKD
ncbi:MAG: trypsin-like peptidase domain-containing protein [Bacteroidales bacterium]|nr:trypsin-like peptidase domain-containing protein [Bacteroidales bacterium]